MEIGIINMEKRLFKGQFLRKRKVIINLRKLT